MIKQVTIKKFQAFEVFKEKSFTPVNVIIGANDTGKTSLLKILYTVCKSWEEYGIKQKNKPEAFKKILTNKIQDTFNPKNNALGVLVKKGSRGKSITEIRFSSGQNIHFSFGLKTTNNLECNEHIDTPEQDFNSIFIPAKEVLTIFKAVEVSRQNLFIPDFDDTYFDLVKSLKIPTQKGRTHQNLYEVNNVLEELFEGKIKQESQKGVDISFVYQNKARQKFSMSNTAEGIKKIGLLSTLIRNRQLTPGTVLFFDEPEVTLHPNAIRRLAEIIYKISATGIQIFMSTHNYFMIKQLSIIARREKTDINCISLTRTNDLKSIEHKLFNLINGLPNNSIVEEALKMFDEETELDLV